MKALLINLIRGYRLLVSPLLPSTCRYTPSCSQYALTAVERFGPIKGSGLAVRRVLRCHPFHPGGYDPVPPNPSSPDSSTSEGCRDRPGRVSDED